MKPTPVWVVTFRPRPGRGNLAQMQFRAGMFPHASAVKRYVFRQFPDLVTAVVDIELKEIR